MADFKAGSWIIGLALYFFIFFLIIYSLVNVGDDMGADLGISVRDPGFQTELNPYTEGGECASGWTYGSAFCSWTNANSNESCSYIPGCTWDGTDCTGIPNLLAYGGECSPLMNETLCRLLDCPFITYNSETGFSSSYDEENDISTIKATFGIMTGFEADTGIPSAFNFIFSFIFFWIPFIMFIWAIYMVIPLV